MPWYPARPAPLNLHGPGWFHDRPDPPPSMQPVSWWAVLGVEFTWTIQWVTDLELQALLHTGLVQGIHPTRALALQQVAQLHAESSIRLNRIQQLRGVYALDMALSIEVNRALTIDRIIDGAQFAQNLNIDPLLSLSVLHDGETLAQVLDVNRTTALSHIAPINLSRLVTANRSLSLTKLRTLAFVQTVTANRAMAFGFPPTATVTDTYSTVGNYSHTIRRWTDFIDIVLAGGAGAGNAGGAGSVNGGGGGAGAWVTATIRRGIDIAYALLAITGVIGAGGPGGTSRTNGTATTAVAPGVNLSAAGGTTGQGQGSQQNGYAPGNKVFNGITYPGGAAGTGNGGAGSAPAGGGAGGTGSFFSGSKGGAGGAGRAWYRSYQ